jgi:hypothetical protein
VVILGVRFCFWFDVGRCVDKLPGETSWLVDQTERSFTSRQEATYYCAFQQEDLVSTPWDTVSTVVGCSMSNAAWHISVSDPWAVQFLCMNLHTASYHDESIFISLCLLASTSLS